MFRFLELELHGWDFWPSTRIPLDADVVILSGPNGSGKTTMLDAIRQILNTHRLSQNRRLAHYLRRPNQPALVRAVVSNRLDKRGRRPFETQRVFTDEATLAGGIVPDGGSPEKRFAVLPGRPTCGELQPFLLEGRDWLSPDLYRRVLERAGVSRSLMHILALEQGRADELSRKNPRELFRWVMEARGSQQVLERYNAARVRFQDSLREVERQQRQLVRYDTELRRLERLVRRLDEYDSLLRRLADAKDLAIGARLQSKLVEASDIERKLPELRTKVVNLTTTVDRLRREMERLEFDLRRLEENVASQGILFEKAKAERDECVRTHALAGQRLEKAREAIVELETIADEDPAWLAAQIHDARQQHFRAVQQLEDHRDRLRVLKERISKLEKGIPVFPDNVQATLNSLEHEGIRCGVAATCIEIEDPRWIRSVESALGPLRYALCVAPEDLLKATQIADRHGFPGPLVTDSATQPLTCGPIHVSSRAPVWLAEWLGQVRFSETDEWEKAGGRVLHMSGSHEDDYGVWVSNVTSYVLGGSAIRMELDETCLASLEIERNLTAADECQRNAAADVALLEARIQEQRRRIELERIASDFPVAERVFQDTNRLLADADRAWKSADAARLDAQRKLDDTHAWIKKNGADLDDRQKELNGTSTAVAKMESDLSWLQDQIVELTAQASPEIRESAQAGQLNTSPEMAERDVNDTQGRLDRFQAEESLPEPTIRDEHKLTLRNIQELEQHVGARQREADSARLELDNCRGEYLQVVGSVLHDYRRRAGSLADIARAKLEIELPSLENTDKSIDEAGITVRIGFDGKAPTEIGDTAHSGGQQVIAGLVLLMAMAETEGDSFFIVDEPFAHLSLDRIDEVGRFLRGSGSQFLITVPTTLDRGQLDPASLLVVLSKKNAEEAFAPRPIIARV